MERLKVLMLTRLFPSSAFPVTGTFCLERARALAEHADVRVMVPTPYFPAGLPAPDSWRKFGEVERQRELEGGVQVIYPRYLSLPRIATFSQGPSMAASVLHCYKTRYQGWRPDVIDAHFAFPDGYAGVRLARSIGCPAVVTCHGADLRVYHEHLFVESMLRWTLQTASRVISVSSDLERRSVAQGCPRENTVFLSNGVDPGKFSLRSKAECRERLGLPLERKIGVYVGYLIDRKNQSLVVKAVDEIRGRGMPTPLIALVGDGPNRQRLEREIADLGLGEDILLAGQRAHAEVATWMGAADWLLLSSDYEGWPTVYFEAMACGRPVLTANVSSAKDAICNEEYGMVVEPSSPAAFASAIIAASSRQYDAGTIRAYAEAHSWQRWAEQAMAVLRAAATTDGGQPASDEARSAGRPEAISRAPAHARVRRGSRPWSTFRA